MSREERDLRAALKATDGNVAATAERLKVSRQTVYARMERFGVRNPVSTAERMRRARSLAGQRTAEILGPEKLSDKMSRVAQARYLRDKGAA